MDLIGPTRKPSPRGLSLPSPVSFRKKDALQKIVKNIWLESPRIRLTPPQGAEVQHVARAPRRSLKDHSFPFAKASRSTFSTRAL